MELRKVNKRNVVWVAVTGTAQTATQMVAFALNKTSTTNLRKVSNRNGLLALFACSVFWQVLYTGFQYVELGQEESTETMLQLPRRLKQQQQQEQQQQQCPIPENHTAMEANWIRYARENGWLPQNNTLDGIPPEGAFYDDEWEPTLDCPSSFETLQWTGNGDGGELACPPGAPMWTFPENSTTPAVSTVSSERVVCPESGTYQLPRGQGILCRNSMLLRPSRNEAAIVRARGLLEKRQEQQQQQKSSNGDNNNNNNGASSSSTNDNAMIQQQKQRPPHVLLFMQDAVSRPALYRNMKALRRTIEDIRDRGKELGTNVYEFKRHHSMGGSSISNLTPMLSGLRYDDMTKHNNTYEAWAFEEFRRMGYVGINTRSLCELFRDRIGKVIGRNAPEYYFPYPMEDIEFFKPTFCPAGKHPRIPLSEVQANCARSLNDTSDNCRPSTENHMESMSCLGGRSRSTAMIEHYLKVREDHKDDNVPTFAFLHDYDLHRVNVVDLHRYDEDKAAVFKTLEKAGVLRDTVIVYVSDHGNQQKIVLTTEGLIEYKLPFLYLMVPDQVLNQRGDHGARMALEHNQRVLTSQPDVHETMLDLAGGRGMGDDAWWQQHGHDPNLNGNSLLAPLPYNRSCDDAGIPGWACICGEGTPIEHEPESDEWNLVQKKVLPSVVNHMNAELEEKHGLASSGVCRKIVAKKLTAVSSRPTTPKLTEYTFRFLVHSPRSEPMEFLASANRGIKEKRGIYIGNVIQVSRFAHWIDHCRQNVTDAGGNHHFCDCVEPPPDGWKRNPTTTATTAQVAKKRLR